LDFTTGELRIQRQVYRANGKLVVSEPKTKAALRTIVLPPSLVEVLKEYRQGVNSRWMFPSPVKEDSPLDPATCRKRLQTILDHAGCKRVRFHDLRHVFVTTALESGMDVKTLSTIIGYVSAKTTLNIYTHVTDTMRQTAAAKIDQGIGRREPQGKARSGGKRLPAQAPDTHSGAAFEPYKGKIRKPGTGCVTQINDHLWEGRYSPKWPDGKKHPRNIYARTEGECEEKLAELIQQTKTEIAEAKRLAAAGNWEAAMALAGQKKARGTRRIETEGQEKTTTL
ncbi:MAG: site-specific integrase, partial [Clostridiales bacterium]|nr:site-specific integrase [Clostridiales bacterium]